MAKTAHLGVILVEQSQAQKEVTVNEAFKRVDAVLNNGAVQAGVTTPPGGPIDGDVYLVGTGATGDWTGQDQAIAYYDQIWRFITPRMGSTIWVHSAGQFYVFDGSVWIAATVGLASNYAQIASVPASQFTPTLISGCAALAQTAIGAGKPDIQTLDFDAVSDESAIVQVTLPDSWDAGQITAEILWSQATSASGDVVWSVAALAANDTETLDASFGTATNVTDSGGTADTLYVTPETAAIVPAGTPSAGNTLWVRVTREAGDAGDTLAQDARFHGLHLRYSITGIAHA